MGIYTVYCTWFNIVRFYSTLCCVDWDSVDSVWNQKQKHSFGLNDEVEKVSSPTSKKQISPWRPGISSKPTCSGVSMWFTVTHFPLHSCWVMLWFAGVRLHTLFLLWQSKRVFMVCMCMLWLSWEQGLDPLHARNEGLRPWGRRSSQAAESLQNDKDLQRVTLM